MAVWFEAGNSYRRKGFSTVDLLVVNSSDELLFLLIFFTKQTTLMRRSTVLSFPIQLGLPA